MILCLLNTFIANKFDVFFSFTKYTSPKLPLPSNLIGMKLWGPTFSSSVVEEFLFELEPLIVVKVYWGFMLRGSSENTSVLWSGP
jgi:hypothetical protein